MRKSMLGDQSNDIAQPSSASASFYVTGIHDCENTTAKLNQLSKYLTSQWFLIEENTRKWHIKYDSGHKVNAVSYASNLALHCAQLILWNRYCDDYIWWEIFLFLILVNDMIRMWNRSIEWIIILWCKDDKYLCTFFDLLFVYLMKELSVKMNNVIEAWSDPLTEWQLDGFSNSYVFVKINHVWACILGPVETYSFNRNWEIVYNYRFPLVGNKWAWRRQLNSFGHVCVIQLWHRAYNGLSPVRPFGQAINRTNSRLLLGPVSVLNKIMIFFQKCTWKCCQGYNGLMNFLLTVIHILAMKSHHGHHIKLLSISYNHVCRALNSSSKFMIYHSFHNMGHHANQLGKHRYNACGNHIDTRKWKRRKMYMGGIQRFISTQIIMESGINASADDKFESIL